MTLTHGANASFVDTITLDFQQPGTVRVNLSNDNGLGIDSVTLNGVPLRAEPGRPHDQRHLPARRELAERTIQQVPRERHADARS
jgi:hypothetical protein